MDSGAGDFRQQIEEATPDPWSICRQKLELGLGLLFALAVVAAILLRLIDF
jgi:hypothetical protein